MKDKLFSIKKMIIKSITFSFLVILTGCANEQTYYSKKFATPSCGVYLPNTPYVACKNEVKSGDERTLAKNKFSLSTNHRSTKPIAPSSSENVRPKPRSSSSGFDMQSGEGYTPTKNNISLNSHRNTKPIAPSSTENVSPKPRSNRSGFDCAGKSTCGQMTSCAEARFYLNSCGVRKLDRDGDGVPCESICN